MSKPTHVSKPSKVIRVSPVGECVGTVQRVRVEEFHRPDYSERDAKAVADWLNGHDRPIANMVPPERDPFMERLRNGPLVVYGK